MSDLKGIVLKSTPLNDHDALLLVLSDIGKVSIKAKGIQKLNSKNRSSCEIGCYSNFHTVDCLKQQYFVLKNAESIKRFKLIHSSLLKEGVFYCMLEIFSKMDFDFELALQYILQLDSCDNPYCIYGLLLSECFKKSGIDIVVDECVCCSSTNSLCGFSIRDGGFICKNCFDKTSNLLMSVNDLKSIRYAMHANITDYEILEKESFFDFELVELLYSFFQQYGEIFLQSHLFLRKIQPLV